MDIFKCYTVEGTNIHNYINTKDFDNIIVDKGQQKITKAQLLLFPLYDDYTSSCRHAVAACPLGLAYLTQAPQASAAKTSEQTCCISIDPAQWTVGASSVDRSILLNPSGNHKVLLLATNQECWLRSRKDKGRYLTVSNIGQPKIIQLSPAQQAVTFLSGTPTSPAAVTKKVPVISTRLQRVLKQSGTKKSRLDTLLKGN